MSGHEGAGRETGSGIGVDVPRVPVSAGAWGAGSAQALEGSPTDERPDLSKFGALGDLGDFGRLGGELLRAPHAWKAAKSGAGAGAGVGVGFEGAGGAGAGSEEAGGTGAGAERRDEDRAVEAAVPTGGSTGLDPGARSEGNDDAEPDRSPTPERSAGSQQAQDNPASAPEPLADPATPESSREPDGALGAPQVTRKKPHALPEERLPHSRAPQRRSGADPVKALMHRHRELCERAVDPLEIAAGLEAHGVTDRTAARFRHKDVFSLAEEMYARVPSDGEQNAPIDTTSAPVPAPTTGVRGAWAVLALLPGAVCALTLLAMDVTTGTTRWAIGVGGALAGAAALRTTLRHGPLRVRDGAPAPTTRLWAGWLLAYSLLGDGLLNAALAGGPDEAWAPATAPLLALAVAVAPAHACTRLYTSAARRRLTTSRGLAEFTASARPLLLGSVALFALALAALLGLSGALLDQSVDYAGAGALGVLLLLARLLTVHGRTHAPAVVLGAAAAVQALAVASVFAARLPGCDALGTPVEAAVDALGVGVVPGAACGAAALALLVHATRTLARASAHARATSATGGAP